MHVITVRAAYKKKQRAVVNITSESFYKQLALREEANDVARHSAPIRFGDIWEEPLPSLCPGQEIKTHLSHCLIL